jgi:hypothetical protein
MSPGFVDVLGRWRPAVSRTIRVYWPNRVTRWVNFNWGGVIDRQSVVHVSVSEGALSGGFGGPLDGIIRKRGAAPIGVRNVRPHEGGVEMYIEVLWDSPLNVVTDISVLDPPEDGFIIT